MTATFLTALAVLLALPLIAFRRGTLRRALLLQAALYGWAWILSRQIGAFDLYLAAVALLVAQLVLFSWLLATVRADEVRWSANRAALMALLVYAVMIPAMLRTPIDGDEPFYLLVTESLAQDHDLDLANQYRQLGRSAAGRPDLVPQLGDPVGPHGEQYSHHEPFLPLLLLPGYGLARLAGAIATVALFGSLLVRSTVRLFEEEGIEEETSRAVFPLFAFGPPVVFYAARIWPEVPAAFFFVEIIRGIRQRRAQRWIPAVVGMTLLKLRFILIALPLLVSAVRRRSQLVVLAAAVGVPLLMVWLASGSATSVHHWRELLPVQPRLYAIGLFGLLLDGMSGVAFQAPFYLLGVMALARWRETPQAFRLGVMSSLLYIVYLVPRAEWHGGWSPPLRYVVVFTPVFALGAASMWRRVSGGVVALIAVWTAGLLVHGAAFPYRLFHIANGENAAGEALSRMFGTDFSRLFPSFIRVNQSALTASILLLLFMAAFSLIARWNVPALAVLSAAAVLLGMMSVAGRRAGAVVQFEDAHVEHSGGDLHPPQYTVARFLYRGGWILHAGQSLSFLSRGGAARLEYAAALPSLLECDGRLYPLQATGTSYGAAHLVLPGGRVTLRLIHGVVNLDSLTF